MMLPLAASDPISVTIHQGFSRVILLYAAALTLWGIVQYFRRANPGGQYLGALIILQGVVTLQGLIGIVLLLQGHRPGQLLHILYGVVIFLTLPAAYLYSDNATTRRDSLVFTLATLLMVGLGIRALATGQAS